MNESYTYTSTPTPTPKSTFSRLGLSIVWLMVGTTVGEYAIAFLLLWASPAAYSAWWANWLISIVPLYGIGLPLMYLTLQKLPTAPHNAVCSNGFVSYEKPAFTKGHWVRILFMGFGCMYIGSIVGSILMGILSGVTGYPYANALEEMVDGSPLWATLLGTCVVAPLGEEFIFRKLFIDRARRFGDAPAIIFSGVLFGLFHGNLFQFFYAAALGILLAYVYTRTNNIWLTVSMHAAVNLMGGVIVPALSEMIPEDVTVQLTTVQMLISLAISVWAYGSIIAAIVLFIKRFKWRVLAASPDWRPTRSVLYDAVNNPGMIAALAVLVFTIIVGLVVPVVQFYLTQLTL